MRKATMSKLAIIITIAQVMLALSATVARANTCDIVEYYNPSLGKIITAQVCYDATIADDEIDDSVEIDETILDMREPVKGETGFRG